MKTQTRLLRLRARLLVRQGKYSDTIVRQEPLLARFGRSEREINLVGNFLEVLRVGPLHCYESFSWSRGLYLHNRSEGSRNFDLVVRVVRIAETRFEVREGHRLAEQ